MINKVVGGGTGGNVWLSGLGVERFVGCICVGFTDTMRGYRFEQTGK